MPVASSSSSSGHVYHSSSLVQCFLNVVCVCRWWGTTEICSFTSHVWWIKLLIAETLGFSAHRSSPWCFFTSTHIAFQSKDIRAYHLFLFFYWVFLTLSHWPHVIYSAFPSSDQTEFTFLTLYRKHYRNSRCKVFLSSSSPKHRASFDWFEIHTSHVCGQKLPVNAAEQTKGRLLGGVSFSV